MVSHDAILLTFCPDLTTLLHLLGVKKSIAPHYRKLFKLCLDILPLRNGFSSVLLTPGSSGPEMMRTFSERTPLVLTFIEDGVWETSALQTKPGPCDMLLMTSLSACVFFTSEVGVLIKFGGLLPGAEEENLLVSG